MKPATKAQTPPGGVPGPVPLPTSTPAPVPIPLGARIYVSMQGDWWDMIAIRVYGAQRGNEHLMYRLLEENYPLRNIAQFPAGIPVVVPPIAASTEIPLVPWTSAYVVPSP